jgi:FtsZ-binding cell division protein ZapB
MKAKSLVCLVAAATLLANAGLVCALDETGTTTTLGAGTATSNENESTIVGTYAGNGDISTGIWNTFIGYAAGNVNTEGASNTFIGHAAGVNNTTGSYNTFLGNGAGHTNSEGGGNTFIGNGAGHDNVIGNGNVFIGRGAGFSQTGSNRLYIDNCYSGGGCTSPLIYGHFQDRFLKLNGNVGIGLGSGLTPVRQLHMAGSNAVFRMDRSADTASFMLVRTDVDGNPLKNFVVGTNASGANTGEFIINDLGTAVGGAGSRRMTITNNGAVDFTGIVTAPAFIPTSSIAYKANVRTYENALDTVNRLRGVRFEWKESGTPSVGLIAEEVEEVVPEVVAHGGESGVATGVNYSALVGVLVEAVKEQQATITKQESVMSEYRDALMKQREAMTQQHKTMTEALIEQQAAMTKQQEISSRQQKAISQLIAEIDRLKSRDMILLR